MSIRLGLCRNERHEEPSDGNKAAPDRIRRKTQTFKRVKAENRGAAWVGEHHERDLGSSAHGDPSVTDVTLDLSTISKGEASASVGNHPERIEERAWQAQVR